MNFSINTSSTASNQNQALSVPFKSYHDDNQQESQEQPNNISVREPEPIVYTAGCFSSQISKECKTFLLEQLIARGQYGYIVKSADSKTAIKRSLACKEGELINEIEALIHVLTHQSPHIIELLDYCIDNENIFYEMPLCYGSLADFIVNEKLTDEIIKRLIKQLVSAVADIHRPINNRLVVHRDIKWENILIKIDENGEPFLKLADFGCAKIINKGERLTKSVSTTIIAAPEVLGYSFYENSLSSYDEKMDIWSIGCVVLQMLFKENGFWKGQFDKYMMAFVPVKPEFPSNISDDLRDFLDCCFKINDHERWSAVQLLSHKFLL